MMRWPAEWEKHDAVWIGFPGNPAEWPHQLAQAQQQVAAFANAVADQGRGENVLLVCRNEAEAAIANALVETGVQVVVATFGDIWLRDTGPLIMTDGEHGIGQQFRFNGWGGKFEMAGDQDIGPRLAADRALPLASHDWILEGGAIDGDGTGTLVTTEQCVLNRNRNHGLSKDDVRQRLADALHISNICWLGDGLVADHTDGHVDNLARFVAPQTIAIPQADQADDPNHEIFEDAAQQALAAGLQLVRLPSVGRYLIDGDIAPASYMNFYIGNRVIAVPQYGAANDQKAVDQLAALFPDRTVIGLPSDALLRGGGSFHCISQQIPSVDG